MTAIAWDGTNFVVDKQCQNSDIKMQTTKAFINKKGDMVCAVCGYADQVIPLRDWAFKTNMNPKKFPTFIRKEEGGSVLSVIKLNKNGYVTIYRFEAEAYPIVVEDDIYAAGSGRDVCLGAMLAGAHAMRAITIASMVCASVGSTFTRFTLDDKRKRFFEVI